MRRRPGEVRDAILSVLADRKDHALAEILRGVKKRLGDVSSSSVRSYLKLGPDIIRVGRGIYRMKDPN
jgi:hypothetical protein